MLLVSATAGAQPIGTASTLPWVPNGPVRAVATIGSRLYLGGSFTTVSPSGNTAVGLLLTQGTGVASDQKLPVFDGDVYAVVADGLGGWFVGGDFSKVNGQPRRSLARLLPDGSLDPSWTAGVSDAIHAMAVSDGWLYVGGDFLAAYDRATMPFSRYSAAAFSIASQAVAPWHPALGLRGGFAATASLVRDIAVAGGKVYLAGDLCLTSGTNPDTDALMAFDANPANSTPARTLFGATTRREGHALAVANGRLYVAGGFDAIGGAPRAGLASFDVASSTLTPWNPGIVGVYDLAVADGVVYLGGFFSTLGGRESPGLGAVDAVTAVAQAWPTQRLDSGAWVTSVFVDGDRVLAGGSFRVKEGGSERVNAAEFSRATGSFSSWKPDPSSRVQAFAPGPNGGTWVAGTFRRHGAVWRNSLAGIDLRAGALLSWDADLRGTVEALSVYGDNWLIVGGDFIRVGTSQRGGLASFDTSTGALTPFNPHGGFGITRVRDLAIAGQTLYELVVDSSPPLRAIDLATGDPVAGFTPPEFSTSPDFLAIAATRLVVAGRFTRAGGQPRNGLASLNRTTGALEPWNPMLGTDVMGWVSRIVVAGDTIYSGFYSGIDGGVAAISMASGDARDLGLRFLYRDYVGYVVASPPVALALQDGLLFLGGYFETINNGPRAGLAAVDLATNGVTGWTPSGRSPVTVLHARPGLLVAGSPLAEAALFPLESSVLADPPTLLTAIAQDTTVTISWRPPLVGPRPTGYSLEAGTAAGLRNIATVPVSGTTLTATAPPGRYFLRVRSATGAGVGPPTGDVELLVTCPAPGPPLNLTAALAANGTLTLAWSPPTGAAPAGYLLEAGYAPGTAPILLPLPLQTSFSVVPPVGTYYIRVRSTGPCGTSAPGNEVMVTVTPPAVPGAPTSLSHTVSARTVTLTWSAPASGGPVTGYVLDGGTAAGSSNLASGTPLGTGTSFTASAVGSGTYFVRLRSVGPGGSSQPSAELVIVVP
jgi:hypothetical protein